MSVKPKPMKEMALTNHKCHRNLGVKTKLEANTRSSCIAWENVHEGVMIGLAFTSD